MEKLRCPMMIKHAWKFDSHYYDKGTSKIVRLDISDRRKSLVDKSGRGVREITNEDGDRSYSVASDVTDRGEFDKAKKILSSNYKRDMKKSNILKKSYWKNRSTLRSLKKSDI